MTTTQDTRAKTLQVRVRPAEFKTLSKMAAREGEAVSVLVRRAIRRLIEQEGASNGKA